jgi:hypothetical protein
VRADFIHLRKWRKSVEQAQSYTFKAVITVIATGFVGAVWMGIKVYAGESTMLMKWWPLRAAKSQHELDA